MYLDTCKLFFYHLQKTFCAENHYVFLYRGAIKVILSEKMLCSLSRVMLENVRLDSLFFFFFGNSNHVALHYILYTVYKFVRKLTFKSMKANQILFPMKTLCSEMTPIFIYFIDTDRLPILLCLVHLNIEITQSERKPDFCATILHAAIYLFIWEKSCEIDLIEKMSQTIK